MNAERILEAHGAEVLQRTARLGAEIVEPRHRIDRLLGDLDDQRSGARMSPRRHQPVLEPQAGQIAGEQEIALDREQVDRPLGRDLRGVFGKQIAVLQQVARPHDLVDIALDDAQADDRAGRIERLQLDHGARQHVAVDAVAVGDPLGDLVDRGERHLAADEFGVVLREFGIGE